MDQNGTALSRLYFVTACMLAALSALVNPPFMLADEIRHFFRAVQISHGGLTGIRLPNGSAGGYLPQPLAAFGYSFAKFRFAPQLWIDPRLMQHASTYEWGGPLIPCIFQNTVIYPPIFYLPAATAIFLARHAHMHLLATMYVARAANGICCVSLSALAVKLAAPPARAWLLLCLSLPVVTGLYGSISQDGLLLACAALAAALLSRCAGPRAEGGTAALAACIALLALIIADKPPYLLVLLLPPLLASDTKRAVLFCVPALLAAAAWWLYGVHPLLAPYHDFDTPVNSQNVSVAGQLHFLRAHPGFIPTLIYNTFVKGGAFMLHDSTATIGWVDAGMKPWFYNAAIALAFVLAGIYAAILLPSGPATLARLMGLILLLLGSALAIALSMYLIWDPVGFPSAWGTNGRYFTPLYMLLAPGAAWAARGWITARLLPAMEQLLLRLFMPLAGILYLATTAQRFWWPH